MKKFEKLKELVASMDDDMYKFHLRLNNAAGTRIRKKMQEIKAMANEIRAEVQQLKKGEKEGPE